VIKCFIFDLDQTLVNTLSRFYRVFNITLKDFNLKEITWKDFIVNYARDTLDRYIPRPYRREFWEIFLEKYSELIGEVELIDGAEDCLRYLKRMFLSIVVVTGRRVPVAEVMYELAKVSLIQYVDATYTAARIPFKDHVTNKILLFKKVLNDFMLEPSEALVVADYRADIIASKSLKIKVIGVLTGLEREEVLRSLGASAVVYSVKELCTLLKSSKLISFTS